MHTKRPLSPAASGDDWSDAHNPAAHSYKRARVLEPRQDRLPSVDVLSMLSDELLVRILSHLSERTLLGLSLVSHRFHRLASDSQLWRRHYYTRFILPRAHRIPGFKSGSTRASSKLHFSGQKSVWADGGWTRRGAEVEPADSPETDISKSVDWKKQYKLRHNWAQGRCAVDEVPVHGLDSPAPVKGPTVVKVVEGLAVTVDVDAGLRAWDLRTRKPIAQASLGVGTIRQITHPTCLAVDSQRLNENILGISVGFSDGSVGIWRLDSKDSGLKCLHRWETGAYGELEALAYGYPHLLTATRGGSLLLYTLAEDDAEAPAEAGNATRKTSPEPYLLTALKSHSIRSPIALSIRKTPSSTIASIAYTFDAAGGWAIGIQDLDIGPSGVFTSRVAYSLPTPTRNSAYSTPENSPSRGQSSNPPDDSQDDGPIRLRYSHPYLLATMPDNTLILHLCTSTATSLSISPGIRLWGHTSGISDAEITPRGKAVSVSTRGDEIRVWELEGRVGGSSVEVRPRQQLLDDADYAARPAQRLGSFPDGAAGLDYTRNQVGFDDEMVIVLKEAQDGRESLMLYDFT